MDPIHPGPKTSRSSSLKHDSKKRQSRLTPIDVNGKSPRGDDNGDGTGDDAGASGMQGAAWIARTVLETLQEVANYAPVPFLSESAGLALGIFNAVERAHANKEDLRVLAKECVGLVYITKCALDNPDTNPFAQDKDRDRDRDQDQKIPEALKRDLEEVYNTLKLVEKFVKEKARRRNILKRIVMGTKDAEDIKVYQRKVEQVIRSFNFKSSIEQRQMLHGIASSVKSPISPLDGNSTFPGPSFSQSQQSPTSIDNSIVDNSNSVSFFSNATLTNMSPGALTINNVTGDSHHPAQNYDNSTIVNSGNVWNTSVVNSGSMTCPWNGDSNGFYWNGYHDSRVPRRRSIDRQAPGYAYAGRSSDFPGSEPGYRYENEEIGSGGYTYAGTPSHYGPTYEDHPSNFYQRKDRNSFSGYQSTTKNSWPGMVPNSQRSVTSSSNKMVQRSPGEL